MAVGVPLSIDNDLMFGGRQIRIVDLDNEAPSSTDFLEANVALIWPYSSSTERLSLLLTEEAPLARKTKSQLKVTFHGSCAKEVALIKVGIGDSIKLRLNQAEIADNCDNLSTPGKRSSIELHFSHSILLQVCSAARGTRRVNFVAPAESPISLGWRSATVDIDIAKATTIPIAGAQLSLRTDSRFSSSSFAESFIDPFSRKSDHSDAHRNKRTKFARQSGAWRLIDEKDENVNGHSFRQDSFNDNGTVTEPIIQKPVNRRAQDEEYFRAILEPDPAASQHDPLPASPTPFSGTQKPFTPAVEIESPAEQHKHSNETELAERNHPLQNHPATEISTPHLEAVPSSALPLIFPLGQRSQNSHPFLEYAAELEASTVPADPEEGEKSLLPITKLDESRTTTSKASPAAGVVDIVEPVPDELYPVPTNMNSDFVDLDLLEYQVNLEQSQPGEKPHAEDEDMYSPHLQIRPYIEQEQPLLASSSKASENEPDSATKRTQISHDSTLAPDHGFSFDVLQEKDTNNTQAALVSITPPQSEDTNRMYAYWSGEQDETSILPVHQTPTLVTSVKKSVEIEEIVHKLHSPIGRKSSAELETQSDLREAVMAAETPTLESREATRLGDVPKFPPQYGDDAAHQFMSPPATQTEFRLPRSAKQPTITTAIPPTPSDSQIKSQYRFGHDGVTDSETANAELKSPKESLPSTSPVQLEARPSLQLLSELQLIEGLSSDYFTPSEGVAKLVAEKLASPVRVLASTDDLLNQEDSQELESVKPMQNPPASRSLEGSTSTSTSYYPPLNSLFEHYGQAVDIIAVCTADSTVPQRAQTGPKHFYTTLHVVDRSGLTHNSTTVTIQLFRYRQDALPTPKRGEVVILRNMKVQTRSHKPLLLSTDESAWAVFGFDDLSNPHVVTAGPPIEFGEPEEYKARLLRDWWLEAGETRYLDHPTAENNDARESAATPRQASKKQAMLHIDLRRSPRHARTTDASGTQFEIAGSHEGLNSSSPQPEPQSPSSRMQLSRNSMPPPNTPSWSAISPIGNESLNSVPPTPSSDRAKLQWSPQSPNSDIGNADTGSIITTASIATTNTSRRRSVRRSTSLVHELRDGTQYVDVEEVEMVSTSGSDEESAADQKQEEHIEGLEAHRNSRRPKKKTVMRTNTEVGNDKEPPSTTVTSSKARLIRPRGTSAQMSPTQAIISVVVPNSESSGVPIDNNPRLTRSKTKANKTSPQNR